ncbi:dual OB domain-containing protein [Brumimicrobium aurantiacum]|uniref:Dual OB-containing domain-containing protein n=1 Tax=Brumimicrobium aurantiacum TaxID=1737063 RepID=A0A3E1EVM2_9FLAO|nr:hypothetical protein [Brumimicrobium aurantiacum]RFC53616.1 hypothetical protein DXU93_12695 [Brumimicrobium aurantiacum]
MKEIVIILSKTKMNNNQVCVGGLTLKGRYVRLLDEQGNNQPENTDLAPKQGWEIEFEERPNNNPPHVEDILVHNRISKGKLKDEITIKDVIEKRNIPIWRGHPDELFDKLIQWTQSGSGYIDRDGGIPNHSVGFWISDKDLKRKEYNGIRYQYPSTSGWRSIKFKGLEKPVDIIPAGTLIRVSLARWVSFNEGEKPKCWLQLSGWYDLGEHSDEEDDLPF